MSAFTKTVQINPINKDYHGGKKGFCEQMSALYLAGVDDNHIKLIRSFIAVGTSGMSSFDVNRPGEDSPEGWAVLDDLIDNHGVCGTFHTHPQGFVDFSEQDWRSMIGLSQANGRKLLFHGIQPLGHSNAQFVCLRMLAGQVICQNIGWIESNLDDPVILLPRVQSINLSQGIIYLP